MSEKSAPFYREIGELYGYRLNVPPYATSSSSGKAVYVHISTTSQEERYSSIGNGRQE